MTKAITSTENSQKQSDNANNLIKLIVIAKSLVTISLYQLDSNFASVLINTYILPGIYSSKRDIYLDVYNILNRM